VQQAFVEHGGFQCGFCTPGMILAVKALLAWRPAADDAEIRHFMRGNICRCTGYVKILEAIKSLTSPGGP
jgi:carbon-monoxide dehydrogenase small subunit